MKRFSMAVAAMSCLAVTYQVYARWFESITAVDEPIRPAAPAESVDRPVHSPEIVETAKRWLEGESWAEEAKYAFERADNVYIYTDSVQLLDEAEDVGRNRVRFAPFAMVIGDPDEPTRVPYVIVCESARVQFEQPFRLEFGAPKPGRLVGGTLDGQVRITGPDGLELHGQSFVFSEAEAQLYSDHPVAFAYGSLGEAGGRQIGSASGGLDIDLITSHDGLLGRDGPHIGGIATIALRRDVRLDLAYEQDGKPMEATISSSGILEFNVASRIATFEDDVVVIRPTSAPGEPLQADRLFCDWLALQFDDESVELIDIARADESAESVSNVGMDAAVRPVSSSSGDEDAAEHPFSNLRLRQLRAHGERAVLQSDENRLIGRMHELRYDAGSRQVVLLDDETVQVQYDSTELMTRSVEVVHDANGEVVSLECRGTGRMEQFPETAGPPVFRAFWEDRLHYGFHSESELWLIQLDGQARVVQTGQVGMQADHLALWVEPELVEQYAGREAVFGGGPLPLKYAQADGHVLMASAEYRIETEQLKARFSPARLVNGPDRTGLTENRPGETGLSGPESRGGSDADEIWTLRARDVRVHVLHDPSTEKSDLAEATATGQVQIGRRPAGESPPPNDRPLSIEGEELHLENPDGTGHLLTLFGEPAHIRQGDLHLEARDLVFDRRNNTAHVEGRGMLQFPVSVDLSGRPLETPVPLDVHWREQMMFDGRQAQFYGNVVLKLNDGRVNESRLYCEDLNVVLNEYVSFREEGRESQDLQFTHVTCRDGVRAELYEWDGTRLSGIRVAELAEFTLEHETGLLKGLGPGVISSWTRGGGRRISIAPDATAEANQPAESDEQEWEYTQVHFSRTMTGNARQRTVQLNGRVRSIYAPVQHPREVFTRDELSGDSPNAKNAVWLGCDELTVGLHPWEGHADEDYAVFGATGHCELEGQLFRAVADLISFDESKELFTLKGLGDRKASIYYQRNPGDQPARLSAQMIQFIPSKQRVSLQGASGFQASP